jgi:hypothetical protein
VRQLEARAAQARPRGGALRVAFAGAITAGLLVALSAVGGIGYAATTADDVVDTVKRAWIKQSPKAIKGPTSARDHHPSHRVTKAKKKVKVKKKKAKKAPRFTGAYGK